MWSDPIDSALAQLQALLPRLRSGLPPTADSVERAERSAQTAREVRAFEQREGRLVTPEDRW